MSDTEQRIAAGYRALAGIANRLTERELQVSALENALATERGRNVEVTMRKVDWTADERGRSNSSPLFKALVQEVARIIRGDGSRLLAGDTEGTATLILAQLAWKHGLAPVAYAEDGPCERCGDRAGMHARDTGGRRSVCMFSGCPCASYQRPSATLKPTDVKGATGGATDQEP